MTVMHATESDILFSVLRKSSVTSVTHS